MRKSIYARLLAARKIADGLKALRREDASVLAQRYENVYLIVYGSRGRVTYADGWFTLPSGQKRRQGYVRYKIGEMEAQMAGLTTGDETT